MKTDSTARPCENMGYDRCQCSQNVRYSRLRKFFRENALWNAEFQDLTKTNPKTHTGKGELFSKSLTSMFLIINLLNLMLLHGTRNSRNTVSLDSMLRVHFEPSSNVETLINQSVTNLSLSFKVRGLSRLEKRDVLVHTHVENRMWVKNGTDCKDEKKEKDQNTKKADIAFLMKTYHWPPWLEKSKIEKFKTKRNELVTTHKMRELKH